MWRGPGSRADLSFYSINWAESCNPLCLFERSITCSTDTVTSLHSFVSLAEPTLLARSLAWASSSEGPWALYYLLQLIRHDIFKSPPSAWFWTLHLKIDNIFPGNNAVDLLITVMRTLWVSLFENRIIYIYSYYCYEFTNGRDSCSLTQK